MRLTHLIVPEPGSVHDNNSLIFIASWQCSLLQVQLFESGSVDYQRQRDHWDHVETNLDRKSTYGYMYVLVLSMRDLLRRYCST